MNTQPKPGRVRPPASDGTKRNWMLIVLGGGGAVVFAMALIGLTLFLVFTSRTPVTLPETSVTQEDQDALAERWANFQHDVTSDRPTAPLQVCSRDFNAFVAMMPRLRSRVYGGFEGNKIHCQVSMPLSPRPKSRYLNGIATVEVKLKDGALKLNVTSCRVNGHALPRWICRQLGRRSFNPEAFWIMEDSGILPHLKSIDAVDHCMILTPVLCVKPEQ